MLAKGFSSDILAVFTKLQQNRRDSVPLSSISTALPGRGGARARFSVPRAPPLDPPLQVYRICE